MILQVWLRAAAACAKVGAMSRTIYYTATTLDGFIADENNSLDWLFAVEGSGEASNFGDFFAGIGAMAMGATTFTWVVEHERLTENPEKWTSWYGDRPTWVFTHHALPEIPGADVRFVQGDVRPVHADMMAAAGERHVWLVGGGDLVGQFADAGLLDEIIASIAPVTLGAGAPLLPRRLTNVLRLVDARTVNDAFVEVRYTVKRAAEQPSTDA